MKEQIVLHQGDTNSSQEHSNYTDSHESNTQELLKRDADVYLHQALSTPVMNVLSKTEGAYIYDHEGKRYLDLHGNGVHNVGFHNPVVVQAVQDQLAQSLAFTPRRYTNLPAIELAEQLTQAAPDDLNRVLFCPGGSEAIEMAIILAKQVTGKWKTISFWDCYHGTTYQAATVGGDEHFTTGQGPMVPGAFYVEFPRYYRNPWGLDNQEAIDELYLRQIKLILKKNPDIACIIGTPIASAPYVPSVYYWEQVRELCDKHDIFLIFDEIICGLGRSGRLFASEHFVTPDVLVMGKSLGGGLVPFAGILAKEKHNIVGHRSIGHFTHEKNPLCCAAASATLNYLDKHQIIEKVAKNSLYFKLKLEALKEEFEAIGHVKGMGYHWGIDLVKDRESKERATELARQVLFFCLEEGLSFKVYDGSILTFRPSLIIGQSEIDFIISTLRKAFNALTK